MCGRWIESFENFYEDVGEGPSDKHILGRIDTGGDYEPSNCKWATRTEQNRKRRNSVHLTIEGAVKTIMEWSNVSGVEYGTIKMRLFRGWSPEEAVFGKNLQCINN